MKSDFMRVDEVVTELDVSRPFAYRVIRQLNDELKKLGYATIAGRVNREYFRKRFGIEGKEGTEYVGSYSVKYYCWYSKHGQCPVKSTCPIAV